MFKGEAQMMSFKKKIKTLSCVVPRGGAAKLTFQPVAHDHSDDTQ